MASRSRRACDGTGGGLTNFGEAVVREMERLGFKGFLNASDIIVGLTNGGPGTSTRSIAMTIVTGFTGGDYAYQMANATFFFLITILISLVQLRATRGRSTL